MNKFDFVESNRLGQFDITDALLFSDWQVTRQLMSNMLIVSCEHLYYTKGFRYVAYSPLFEPCEQTAQPPRYIFEATSESGEIEIVAKRMDA